MGLTFVAHISQPICAAIDIQGVVTMAQQLLTWARQHPQVPPPGLPLALLSDGDLWDPFFQAVLTRGPVSIWVCKTTGHAKEKAGFLGAKAHLAQEAIHNEAADNLAKKGRTHHLNPKIDKLAATFIDRFQPYILFCSCHSLHQCRVYLALDELRRSNAFRLAQGSFTRGALIIHTPPWIPAQHS